MRRVAVVGNSGSGKTWLSSRLAARLGVPYLEVDSVMHQPGWTPLPVDELTARVSEFTRGDGWVVDGNYSSVRPVVWERADTVVWLDPSRARTTRQIVGRSLARVVTRRELWNGNRERWGNLLSLDPDRSVIAWSLTKHGHYRRTYLAASAGGGGTGPRFVRLRTRRDVARFLAALPDRRGGHAA